MKNSKTLKPWISIEPIIDKAIEKVESDLDQLIQKGNSLYYKNLDLSKKSLSIKSTEDKRNFWIAQEIKYTQNGVLVWNEKYKKEVLENFYSMVLGDILCDLKTFKARIKLNLEDSILQADILLSLEKELLNKILDTEEGLMYFNEENRKSMVHLLGTRFDLIWFLNERNMLGGVVSEPNETILTDTDYPFFEVNIQQWICLEKAYLMLPLLKDIERKLSVYNKNTQKKPPHKKENKEEVESIFSDTEMENLFFDVLKELEALDYNGKAINGKFGPICDAFFKILNSKEKDMIFKYQVKKKDYICFLNRKCTANIKSSHTISSGYKHEERVRLEIKKRLDEIYSEAKKSKE